MKQQGAALVIVMALLSGALILGVSGMNSALIDERLAGNYRASVQAQMNSDSMMSDIHSSITEESGEKFNDLKDDVEEGEEKVYTWKEMADLLDFKSTLDNTEKMKVKVKVEDDEVIITTQDDGTNNNAVRQTVATYQRGGEGSGPEGEGNNGGDSGDNGDGSANPFESPIVGCEGVTSGGGSTISSYRSSEGAWNGQPGSFAENDIPLIRTTADNANVLLGEVVENKGNEQIHGSIAALGTVTLKGSSQVFGNILANRTISMNGGGVRVRGNAESLADVIFGSSARVDGVVKAGGDVNLSNWSASVGKGIYAQGEIYSPRNPPWNPPERHIDEGYRDYFFSNTSVSIAEIEDTKPQPCDTADFAGNSLNEEIVRYQDELDSLGKVIVNDDEVDIMITPNRISVVGGDKHEHINGVEPDVATVFGESSPIYYVDDLKMASTSKLHIGGGDVVLVIGGEFSMDGGGKGLVIDPDSSLTVFVAGQTDLGSVVKMPVANSINNNGKPTFSLFSGYSGAGTGVNFRSSNRVVANVYAPYSSVSVNTGASLFGSVKGRNVNVDGGSKIVYDELLAESFGGPSNGSPETEGDGGWQLVGWQ